MIHKEDLLEAIMECRAERNPNANTCIKLSAYITILNFLENEEKSSAVEDVPAPTMNTALADVSTGSEFCQAIQGKSNSEVIEVMDELMETLKAINPRLYSGVLRKLS